VFRSRGRCEVVWTQCVRVGNRCSPEHLEDGTVVVQPDGGLITAVGARLQGLRQEHVPNDASTVEEPAGLVAGSGTYWR